MKSVLKVNLHIKSILLCVFFTVISFNISAQFYNGLQLNFGKNRIQTKDLFWSFYSFNKFDTYFYLGGQDLAVYTAKYAEKRIKELEKKLDYSLDCKIQFVIYNKLSDLKESNIGLLSEDQYNIGGITYIVGSKVILYFDGNHQNFEQQISCGITNIILNQIIFGRQLTAMVKNSTLLSLPDWYIKGLVSYFSVEWNSEIDNYVRDGILSFSYEKFNQLEGEDAVYAGHSIWKYVEEKYGKSKINEIINLTRISRNIETSFLFSLGISFKTLAREWFDYYDSKYYPPSKGLDYPGKHPILKKTKHNKVYNSVKINPDTSLIAFSTNELGKYKVWLYNYETNEYKRIMKSGHKLDEKADYSYPLLAWHPSGKLLSIIVEAKGKTFLYYYNTETEELTSMPIFNFEKILDFSYSDDGRSFIVSAVQNGQTDIFVYNIAAHSYEQITKDIYDDLNPRFIHNSNDIVFSSDRPNDTIIFYNKGNNDYYDILPENYDIYLYEYSKKNPVLKNITNTPSANEMRPEEYNNLHISYISNQNGIYNRYLSRFDSVISHIDTSTHYRYFNTNYPVTNYSRNIIEYDVNKKAGKYSEVLFHNGLYKTYFYSMDSVNTKPLVLNNNFIINTKPVNDTLKEKPDNATPDTSTIIKRKKITPVFIEETPADEKNKTDKIDINNYVFNNQPRIIIIAAKDTIHHDTSVIKNPFILPKQQNADVEYSINQLTNQIDFNYFNTSYQPFMGGKSPIFINPGINLLLKIGITDLLENYRLTGGVNLSANLKDNEYYLSYDNLKKRLDKQVVFHRQVITDANEYSIINHNTKSLYYSVKWPFSQVSSVKGTVYVKQDKATYLSIDDISLRRPDIKTIWAGFKAEYTFDNTRTKGLSLYYGTRYKFFAEYFRNVSEQNNDLTVLGFDFRNYQKIHKTFIWANRFAVSTSFGKSKLIYYMGGVDTWLFPKFNTSIRVDQTQNFVYQTLATNMRGFHQNIRNGNNFALINSELRLPLFRYLSNKPLKSDFFYNFQVIGFTDIGTAWTGLNPYSEDNSLYTQVFPGNPITVIIKNQKEPIVCGYGLGLRSRIFGYFLRADWAWGVENGVVQPPIFYLSLSLDF